MTAAQFLDTMAIDKKAVDGAITLVLLRALGKAVVCNDYDHNKLLATLG